MALRRGIEGSEPVVPQAIRHMPGRHEERRAARSRLLASGTLACPCCDAPVAPEPGPMGLAEPLGCPFCRHAAPARDFLSLKTPGRPARVEVRVLEPARPCAVR